MIWNDLMKLGYVFSIIKRQYNKYLCRYYKSKLGYCSPTSYIDTPLVAGFLPKIYLYENSYILSGASFIISSHGDNGRLIIKKNVAISHGLTVVTGNHQRVNDGAVSIEVF